MTYFRQCKLQKGNQTQVSWIPEEFAKKHWTLKLKDAKGAWDDGWKVENVFGRLEAKECIEQSRDYLKQRRASDI